MNFPYKNNFWCFTYRQHLIYLRDPAFSSFPEKKKKIDSDNVIGVYFFNYFVGIAAKVAFKNSQNLLTDSMFTFSSGE